ncbi:MAG: tetratricopeptide repeat-containing protein [Buchnera aphidicola (Pentalonia nigronervosa)]|jgi:regulator of sirC expression with transglutaminase-like and TPR domain|uniref:Tetratricopeptide repeat-containing protein n=1 Tax=Buchnera aphidicola (Pentalonia nigronervosa) TaxID=1309793 RepID=A0A7H1AZJ3_9GAMM|nr:MAG: tetratricopeptide repeat-containing protein [Buchnera aphidicola (Pentalonia nigronervosa)]
MKSLSDIDFSKLSLLDSAIAVFQIIRSDFPVETVLFELKNKIQEAKSYVLSEVQPNQQLKKLLELFYHHWRFCGASGIYKLSDALWIDNVLKTRQGTAVSLGILLLHIAQELNLPLNPVVFPTQLILRADWVNQKKWLINPFNGDLLNRHILEVWLKGNISPTAELYDNDLYKSDAIIVIRKMLDTLKAALMEEKKIELALNVSNLIIKIDPNDPYEIRDRGLIYAQLECNHVALTDLIYFVEHCPEDPISEIIKVQIHAIEQKKMILH